MKIHVQIFCALFSLAIATKVDYSGHMVIRVVPQTEEQVKFLSALESSSSIDFWTRSVTANRFTDIHVSPESYKDVARALLENGMNHKIHIANIGELEKEEQQSIALRRALFSNNKAIDVENYHTYEEIMAYLADLASTNPLVSTLVAGTSVEGREIIQMTISSDPSANKPIAWFDCNIHAREWITAATCVWIIDTITSGYGTDAEITALVDQYDWKFVPVANPDGYSYSWTNDRMWRKNRAINSGSACAGVDLNRNFPVGFGGEGSSSLPCSETHHGVSAFSEPESQTLQALIAADRGRVKSAISMHSYSQLWLSSYSFSSALPVEYPEMLNAMKAGVDALVATYGTPYEYGSTGTLLYIASGTTTDHYYVNEGVVHSYTIELRDQGRYGFQLPASLIVPTATETWNGIKAYMNAI
ncbi:carboxypeptidase A1-like [Daphnia carinata]|uniref:carboxypeptidase A1-like n=1 Tax=Daphnia carinata TaxID=120202 RepID=UPI00257DFE99|nr:carboxypeptidase A1-like [Daphnia carinata]